MSAIKVSVIVPVYRVGEYFEKLLDKLIHQTLKEIEIILVDDKGGDDSFDIARKYANQDSRIILLENPENRGSGYSRNRGMEKAKGEYLAFIDADDDIPLNYFESLYNCARKSKKKVVKCPLRRVLVDGQYVYSKVTEGIKNKLRQGAYKTLLPIYTCEHTTGLYQRSWVKAKKAMYAENARRGQDTCFLMTLMHDTSVRNLEITEDVCYTYRQYEQSYEIKKADAMYLEHMKVAGLFKIDFLLSKEPHPDVTAYLQLTFEQRLGAMLTKAFDDGVSKEDSIPYLAVFAERLKLWKSSPHDFVPLPYTAVFALLDYDINRFLELRHLYGKLGEKIDKLEKSHKVLKKAVLEQPLLLYRAQILREYRSLRIKKCLAFGKKKQQLVKQYEKIKKLKRKSDAQLLSIL